MLFGRIFNRPIGGTGRDPYYYASKINYKNLRHEIPVSGLISRQDYQIIIKEQRILADLTEENIEQSIDKLKNIGIEGKYIKTSLIIDTLLYYNLNGSKAELYLKFMAKLREHFDISTEENILKRNPDFEFKVSSNSELYDNMHRINMISSNLTQNINNMISNQEIQHKIRGFIIKDDVDGLQNIVVQPNIQGNRILDKILNFSAKIGSLKCFKYLIQNGYSIADSMNSAISGGNNVIIEILEQSGVHPDKTSIFYAISNHRYDIYDWLFERFEIEFDEKMKQMIITICLKERFLYGLMRLSDSLFYIDRDLQISYDVSLYCVAEYFLSSKEFGSFKLSNYQPNIDYSLRNNDIPMIELMIKYSHFKYYEDCILIATEYGYADLLKLILSIPGINANGSIKCPLYIACQGDNFEVVKLLANFDGVDINGRGKSIPIIAACQNQNRFHDYAKFLLSFPNININIKIDNYPLTYAIRNKDIELINLIIQNPTFDPLNEEQFLVAVADGNLEIVKLLMGAFVLDWHKSDLYLSIAISNDNKEVADFFLSMPELDLSHLSSDPAIYIAATREEEKYINAIISHHTFQMTNYAKSKIMSKAIHMKKVDTIRTIMDLPVAPNDNELIKFPKIMPSNEVLTLFLSYPGIDVNKNDSLCPLYEAIQNANIPLIKLILSYPGVNPNGNEKNPTLCLAINNIEILKLLLDTPGIDPNGFGTHTPLIQAIGKNKNDAVELLIKSDGIDLNKSVSVFLMAFSKVIMFSLLMKNINICLLHWLVCLICYIPLNFLLAQAGLKHFHLL